MKYTKLILDERMIVPEPKIRLEFFLHAIVTGETCELKPKTVDEEYLYAIATSDTSRIGEIYPRTLVEIYYDAILNNSVEDLPTPRTRWEEFLRSAVTKEPCELEPETSLEIYLSQISSNGGFDYIVSTSTNSTIISLPNSTNGTIKSIEMDGNTLVNLIPEGTFTSLDNFTVAENKPILSNNTIKLTSKGFDQTRFSPKIQNSMIKPNTKYTFIFNVLENNLSGEMCLMHTDNPGRDVSCFPYEKRISGGETGIFKYVVESVGDISSCNCMFRTMIWNNSVAGQTITLSVMILEGDWTNREVPSYFEGMKSCFEDKEQDNGSYEIEVLSNNRNLFDITKRINNSSKNWWVIPKSNSNRISFKFNKTIPYIEFYESNIDNIYKMYANWTVNSTFKNISQGTTPIYKTNKPYIIMAFDLANIPSEEIMKTLQVVYGETIPNDFIPHKSNSIQLQLNEPLRAVGDVKDRFVLRDGKLMIERNCGKGVLSGEISMYHCWNNNPPDVVNGYIYYNEHIPPLNNVKTFSDVKNNLLPSNQGGHISKVEGFINTAYFAFSIHKSKLGISDVNAGRPNELIVRQYFNDNPLEFIYQLAEPTYEEVSTSQKLACYENATLFIDTNIAPTHVEIEYPTEKQQLFRIK